MTHRIHDAAEHANEHFVSVHFVGLVDVAVGDVEVQEYHIDTMNCEANHVKALSVRVPAERDDILNGLTIEDLELLDLG